ncbi:MAG: AAA family ATPase [Clostridiales Family XIII bacterium]|nr:AAA family ATPase [Clostridiales Family XIII bacterium]
MTQPAAGRAAPHPATIKALKTLGFSYTVAVKLCNAYGDEAVEIVKGDPYRIAIEIPGIGFKTADAVAAHTASSSLDDDIGACYGDRATAEYSSHRIAAGILYILTRYAAEGHTCVPRAKLMQRAVGLLDVSSDDIEDTLLELFIDGRASEAIVDGSPYIFLSRYFLAERRVCSGFMRLMSSEPKRLYSDPGDLITRAEAWLGIGLSEEQRTAVRDSIQSGVFVVTGGPGTGKTTIIRAVIDIFEHAGLSVAVAAPTGRAAKRIKEATGHKASTIHRLLEYYYDEEAHEMYLGKNAKNELELDAIIIDEASMVDVILMEALLDATATGTRLIIVGDADQLPPVGAGDVLRDILASGRIPCAVLTEIYRQAAESMIVVNAHRVDRGEYPDAGDEGTDFVMLERGVMGDALSDVIRLCSGDLPGGRTDIPSQGIQVISPMKKGLLGCAHLNRELQAALNPPSPSKSERKYGDRVFREGDRVMQIRNNYSLEWTDSIDGSEGRGVFNGDIGVIKDIDTFSGVVTVVYDETKYASYATEGLMEVEHAYAITVHKSQGSEFPAVVIPIYAAAPMLMTRNLIYTAITRGKRLVILVGSMDRLRQMIDNDRGLTRYSGLKSFMMEYMEINEP